MSPMRACAMRFQAANFGITLLFVGCIVATMQLIGRKPIRLTDASDSLNNRVEKSVAVTERCCDEAGSKKVLPRTPRNENDLKDTNAEILRLVQIIFKEHLGTVKIFENGSERGITAQKRTNRDVPQVDSPKMNCSLKLKSPTKRLGIDIVGTGLSKGDANSSKDLVEVMRAFKGTWRENKDLSGQIKHELRECCDVESSVLTKQNVKVGDVLPNVLNRKMPLKISRDVYRVLPKESPFRNKHFQTCAVVGNSGILRGSRCGASIDGAEAVFRCNLPPLGKQIYRKDAGVKSTFTTAPLSMLKSYMQMKDKSVREKFIKDVEPYRGILSLKKPNNYTNYMISSVESTMGDSLEAVYEHPNHFLCIDNYWSNHGLPRKITSGIYIISMALTVCDEVNVYGFWPFPRDDKGHKVHYHYYKAPVFVMDTHDMPSEFLLIRQMHQDGVIKVHMHCLHNIAKRSAGKKKARLHL